MKVIALLTLSLAVVVCEQQTLFAPHFVTFDFQAPHSTGRGNSLRPAAGVNRLAPVNSSYAAATPPRNGIFAGPIRLLDAGKGPTVGSLEHGPGLHDSLEHGPGLHDSLQPTPDPNMNSTAPSGLDRPVFGPLNSGCPPCDIELQNSDGGWEDDPEFRY